MKMISLLILAAFDLTAQTVNLKKAPCPGDPSKPRLVLYVPASVAGSAASVAACVDLGDDLRIVPGAPGAGLKLEMVPRPTPPAPTLRIETVKVPADAGVSMVHTLAAAPVVGSPIMVFSRFSSVPSIAAATVANGRTLTISLPDGPFSAEPNEDTITVVYQAQ